MQQVPKVEVPQAMIGIKVRVLGMSGREVWGGWLLDEKHFRRCDKFEGNPAKFKSWMFDLATAVEYVDHIWPGISRCQ